MSDLVGNPEDRFSRVEAQIIVHIIDQTVQMSQSNTPVKATDQTVQML